MLQILFKMKVIFMNLKFRGLIANIFLRFCWLFPLQDKIVFSSYDGSYFNDNPAAVYKALLGLV